MGSSPQFTADPVLNLLGKMEGQISRIETMRQEPVESARAPEPRAAIQDSPEIRALREELAQAEERGTAQLTLFTEALTRLRTQIPELMEDAIASRFAEVEERFYSQVGEIHQRTMDSFLQSAQAKVGIRMAALEATFAEQARAMAELHENQIKADRNVDRMLGGLDRLTAELMRLSTLAGAPIVTRRVAQLTPVSNVAFPAGGSKESSEARTQNSDSHQVGRRAALLDFAAPESDEAEPRQHRISRPSALFVPVIAVIMVIGLGLLGWQIYSSGGDFRPAHRAASNAATSGALTGTAAQMKTASDFAAEKDYAKAESIYRGVLKTEPENRTAIKELASVLFKQQKYEEAASVLKLLPAGS